ncbi:biotin/lipoyl-containing protein [Jeotgalibaca sp. A122]|uniref:biotin/lipoyl-containing protein n=1 Tax=Jeotgalibaca sp. A122 TaxID=3457322 RepID=UPI003FD30DCC
MKNYEIEIDGQVYQVKVRELPDDEEMDVGEKPIPKSKPVVPTASGEKVTAPMSGTILRVLVQAGQNVKTGDHLVILEAMKMENEIIAPHDGTIKEILVKPNDAVDSGQDLVIM